MTASAQLFFRKHMRGYSCCNPLSLVEHTLMISPSKDTTSWYKANCVFGPTINVYHLKQRDIFVGSNMRVSRAVLATHACRIRMHKEVGLHMQTTTKAHACTCISACVCVHSYTPIFASASSFHRLASIRFLSLSSYVRIE